MSRSLSSSELTSARITVHSEAPGRPWGLLLTLAVVAAALGFFAARHLGDGVGPAARLVEAERELATLREERARLLDEAERQKVRLDVETATKGELERQIVSLNEALKVASQELNFLRSAGSNASPRR